MSKFDIHPDRFFDPNPKVRKIARELYNNIKDLPIISPHGHVNPKILADNQSFPDPTELILIPDHYIFRMLYSQGIPLEKLGVPTVDCSEVETDHRKIWQLFSENFHLFAGTPTGVWLAHEFVEVFGIEERPDSNNAMKIYDKINEKLKSAEFKPRTLFEQFNIEVLSTTDGAADSLEHHQKIKNSGWTGRVVPAFRPDAVVNILADDWKFEIEKLGKATDIEIKSFKKFISALENRRAFFKEMGATSTDQGVLSPYTNKLSSLESEAIFQRALKGQADKNDAHLFTANMLMEMARMSVDDGLVMQIHAGSFRNHNQIIFDRFGLDKGADIPIQTEYTRNLQTLLKAYGNNPAFKLIVFTLDETVYSRELAPLAGHYPAMKLGPAWWFHDSIEGMTRYRHMVTETAGFYNTVGFNDDTRAFLSIPARHDVSRRVDSNFLADQVARHIIDMDQATILSKALAYDLAKEAYKL
ncbi:MAG: glucuronate isomerase [Calditrichaeota bacterium]|nr:MAG: glucuronate isomerase [Calditrichota bacterium]MBL1204742.1 glucuronate isomerase [Calditrichota bacterium]NOG44570.1 glucuronate isomerase [Calditrichota bacterium]